MSGKTDPTALFKIGYGLYVLTVKEGEKENGCIINTVSQLTSNPVKVAVTVNKDNYTHDFIVKTGKMNVNCLSTDAPFGIFEWFGFVSGRDKDKMDGMSVSRSENGIAYLNFFINSFLSLEVESTVDLETHTMFICKVTEAKVLNDKESMTYAYYHANVKPKPQPKEKKGYVCKICGYIYEGEELPADFVCPICKHGAEDFEKL